MAGTIDPEVAKERDFARKVRDERRAADAAKAAAAFAPTLAEEQPEPCPEVDHG
jgi:hypothetical protein